VVGWIVSHPPREPILSASELLLTVALAQSCAASPAVAVGGVVARVDAHAAHAAHAFVVVAARDATALLSSAGSAAKAIDRSSKPFGGHGSGHGSGVTFEAYQVSSQALAWAADGTILGLPTLAPGSFISHPRAATSATTTGAAATMAPAVGAATSAATALDSTEVKMSKTVWAQGKEVQGVDCAVFAVPVPITSHQGRLGVRFPPSNRPEKRASQRVLQRALFGDQGPTTPPSSPARPSPSADSADVLSRLSDFHLLLFLHKRLPDIDPLLGIVKDRINGAAVDIPPYYFAIFEQLCGPADPDA
jgi:hypothetical protein